MQPSGPSRTALGVAALRAMHQLLDGTPKILDDPIAAHLLNAELREELLAKAPGGDAPASHLRAHVVLRSRYAEDCLAAAVGRGIRQYVILGAGFDTFAYRQPGWANGIRVYEVDHPATQDDKRHRLADAGIRLPANLEFVACDMESTALEVALAASSFSPTEPTFFSCLGVLVYLSRGAVDALLRLVARCPTGTQIVFTFSAPSAATSDLAVRARSVGEPRRTHFDARALDDELRAVGFAEVTFLHAEEAARRYFRGRTDGLPPPVRTSIATALVGTPLVQHTLPVSTEPGDRR